MDVFLIKPFRAPSLALMMARPSRGQSPATAPLPLTTACSVECDARCPRVGGAILRGRPSGEDDVEICGIWHLHSRPMRPGPGEPLSGQLQLLESLGQGRVLQLGRFNGHGLVVELFAREGHHQVKLDAGRCCGARVASVPSSEQIPVFAGKNRMGPSMKGLATLFSRKYEAHAPRHVRLTTYSDSNVRANMVRYMREIACVRAGLVTTSPGTLASGLHGCHVHSCVEETHNAHPMPQESRCRRPCASG